jgi:hypothetical protein
MFSHFTQLLLTAEHFTWDCPLKAQVLSTIWCVPAMHEMAVTCPHKCILLWASSEHRSVSEHFVYTNTSSPFKVTKPFHDSESSQSSGTPYTDWLCLDHWSSNWWFLTKPLTYKFKIFTLNCKCVSAHWSFITQNRWLSSAFVLTMVNNDGYSCLFPSSFSITQDVLLQATHSSLGTSISWSKLEMNTDTQIIARTFQLLFLTK